MSWIIELQERPNFVELYFSRNMFSFDTSSPKMILLKSPMMNECVGNDFKKKKNIQSLVC